MGNSLGLIEVEGLSTAIYVADAMVKSANVNINDLEITKGFGMVTVKICGDIGAVTAGVNAGLAIAEKSGKLISHDIIARPSKSVIDEMLKKTNKQTLVIKSKAIIKNESNENSDSKEKLNNIFEEKSKENNKKLNKDGNNK
ncbi:BMC domain-containing protein [Anaerococcus sp. AGMB09787]|uniref:BMC domain-containing protein n=1 Tax=Anaerococcus sp. AGMB09787 TaxID=2922869 RepID=UPI001FAF1A8E|nr:BMC domain-containing protein [Anaerococcus sp. AGMB09787]